MHDAFASPAAAGLTLEQYAKAKRLSLDFLRGCGLSEITYQPVDEVVVSSGRWSKAILKTIRAGMALWATKTMMRASYAPLLVGSRTKKHQPPAMASFGVPAPMSRRISSPRLCPATWIR